MMSAALKSMTKAIPAKVRKIKCIQPLAMAIPPVSSSSKGAGIAVCKTKWRETY